MGTSTVRYKCQGCGKIILPLEVPEEDQPDDGGKNVQCPSCLKVFTITRKEIQSRTGRSSRAKGANFERKIAKQLEKWWPGNYEFKRTPGSGGSQLKVGFDMAGDICTNAPDFKLHLELKNSSASWDGLDQVLSNKEFILWKWLSQSGKDCPPHKSPVVIFTRVGRPSYCAYQMKGSDLIGSDSLYHKLIKAGLSYMMIAVEGKPTVYVWLFDEMMKTDPALWK